MSAAGRPDEVPFQTHLELLRLFLARRAPIVEAIQGLLNAQGKPTGYMQDRPLLSRHFEDCFFKLPAVSQEQFRLRGQLQQARRADGFLPGEIPGVHNDLIDPAEMMIRSFQLWSDTRWPGRNGRIRYAQTLFNLYVLRYLELLALRLWDAGPDGAGDRLAQVQAVLDELWKTSPADQPVLLRNAGWLIPLAQSPANEGLAPYFEVAERLAGSLPEADRIGIHKASVVLAGGHLRSQLRHYGMANGESLADSTLILRSRRSNALDFAMTIQNLVPLLAAYERAVQGGERDRRLELAGAICQGISADPELFVCRVDLLGAYTMIEHLFVADSDGRAACTPVGKRHIGLLRQYAALIGRVAKPLDEDAPHFRPVAGACSAYGLMYGFANNLLEHMALKSLQPDAETRFSLEDAFADGDDGGEKLAWVSGWRKLPHVAQEVQRLYEYPQQFAEGIFDRIGTALRRRVAESEAGAVRAGHLFVLTGEGPPGDPEASLVPDLPVRYLVSSDPQMVAANKAQPIDQARLLHDRQEGECLVSYQTPGGWTAISKDILTEVLGAGQGARIAGLPDTAAAALALMYPDLVRLAQDAD